jgi:hypothetical protein
MKIAFVSNERQYCCVSQFGRSTFLALKENSRHQVEPYYFNEQDSFDDAFEAIASADLVIYNYHPMTLGFINRNILKRTGRPAIGILHEFDYSNVHAAFADIFRYRIAPDPTLISRVPGLWAVPRIVDQIKVKYEPNDIPTIGSFGFALPGKNFKEILLFAERHFSKARVRLHIPNSPYASVEAAQDILDFFQNTIDKKIELNFTQNFLSTDDLIHFLAANDLNIFLYDNQRNRGISSSVDFAIAAERPLALSNSDIFRHLRYFAPELFLDNSSLKNILEIGGRRIKELKTLWSPKNAVNIYDNIFERVIDDWKKPQIFRYNTILNDDMRKKYSIHEKDLQSLCPEIYLKKINKPMCNRLLSKLKLKNTPHRNLIYYVSDIMMIQLIILC